MDKIKERRREAQNYIKRRWFRKMIFEKKGAFCQICKSTENLSLDHKISVCGGGKDTVRNIQVLCLPCNIRKGGHV